jgi:hypothetical protein
MQNRENILGCSEDHNHYCLFYRTKKDLLNQILPFFKNALSHNMFCIWVVPAALGATEAKASLSEAIENFEKYIEKGQFWISDYKSVYLQSGAFNPAAVLENWRLIAQQAIKNGFSGTYVSGDGSWFAEIGWENLVDYEKQIDAALRQSSTKALCTYYSDILDLRHTFVLSSCHEVALAQKEGSLTILKK